MGLSGNQFPTLLTMIANIDPGDPSCLMMPGKARMNAESIEASGVESSLGQI